MSDGLSERWDIDQVCGYLQCSKHLVYRLTRERRIGFVRVGKELRFRPDDVAAWVKVQSVSTSEAKPEPPRPRPWPTPQSGPGCMTRRQLPPGVRRRVWASGAVSYEVSWFDAAGRRHTENFDTANGADAARQEHLRDRRRGGSGDPTGGKTPFCV